MSPSSARAFTGRPASIARPSTALARQLERERPSRRRRRRRRARPARDRSCPAATVCRPAATGASIASAILLGERALALHRAARSRRESTGSCRSRAVVPRRCRRGRSASHASTTRSTPATASSLLRAGDAELGAARPRALRRRASRSRPRRPARPAGARAQCRTCRCRRRSRPSCGEHRLGQATPGVGVGHQRLRHHGPHGEILHVVARRPRREPARRSARA